MGILYSVWTIEEVGAASRRKEHRNGLDFTVMDINGSDGRGAKGEAAGRPTGWQWHHGAIIKVYGLLY